METDRFDRIARALAITPSRRGMARLLATGILPTGLLTAVGGEEAFGQRKKKPKTCKPKCKVCQRCRQGKCTPKKAGKPCAEGKVCEDGRCVRLRCGNGGPCRVFLTSAFHLGSEIGGLEDGDAICQQTAEDARLSGTYQAWLSAGDASPASRFTKRGKAGPYQLVPNESDGGNPPPTVAASFADLTSCDAGGQCLQHVIDRTETGSVNSLACVWTGTKPDGLPAADTCGGWTSAGNGVFGSPSSVNANWTEIPDAKSCDSFCVLYCFEQA